MSDSETSPVPEARLFRVSPEDNVAVAAATIQAGRAAVFEGRTLVVVQDVPTGHKVAVVPIAAGEKVLKHGGPIGSATRDIRPGELVHTHNLKSDYLPTFTLDGHNPFLRSV